MSVCQLEEWGALDTLIITAGVSSTRMFMDSVSPDTTVPTGSVDAESATLASLYRAKSIAQRSLDGNLLAPLVSIASFVSTPYRPFCLSRTPLTKIQIRSL